MMLVLLRRMIALFFIVFALLYWARIVGLNVVTSADLDQTRIDQMPEHWQVASVILAVAMPIASIGLWGLFSWGTSIWLAVVSFELVMFVGFPGRFGHSPDIVWFHVACLITYISIKLAIRFGTGPLKIGP